MSESIRCPVACVWKIMLSWIFVSSYSRKKKEEWFEILIFIFTFLLDQKSDKKIKKRSSANAKAAKLPLPFLAYAPSSINILTSKIFKADFYFGVARDEWKHTMPWGLVRKDLCFLEFLFLFSWIKRNKKSRKHNFSHTGYRASYAFTHYARLRNENLFANSS